MIQLVLFLTLFSSVDSLWAMQVHCLERSIDNELRNQKRVATEELQIRRIIDASFVVVNGACQAPEAASYEYIVFY